MEREKIINSLRCHMGCDRGFDCSGCAYIGNGDCLELLTEDVFDLLKKVKPKRDYDINDAGFVYKVCYCGNCGALLKGGDFCCMCGKEVDWNE